MCIFANDMNYPNINPKNIMTDIIESKSIVLFNGFVDGSVTAGEAPDVGRRRPLGA